MAEEVTEDAYWQVWRQALRFDPARGNAMAWLLTIARSRALDTLRRADPAEAHPEPETLADADFAPSGDPQDLLAERSATAHRTPRGDARRTATEPLALAFFRGLTHEEIAAQTALLGSAPSSRTYGARSPCSRACLLLGLATLEPNS